MNKSLSIVYGWLWISSCFLGSTKIAVGDETLEPSHVNALSNSRGLDLLESKADSLSKSALAKTVPALTHLLEQKEPTLDWRVLRLLQKTDLKATKEPQKLVESVSRLLDDPEQATRSLAVEVLCAIGEPSLDTSIRGLRSQSPRVRACSAVILSRQGKLTESVGIEISRDIDARVRTASINVLGQSSKGIDALITMLSDEETAVACRAADFLGHLPETESSEKIVRGLESALTRPEVAYFAAISLARLGSDARSAIPKLLAVCPIRADYRYFNERIVEVSLAHIGEPRESDISEIISLLEQGNAEKRALVCQILSKFGIKAKSASELLARMMRLDLARDDKQNETLPQFSDMRQPFLNSAAAALSAFWFTTRDAIAFRALAEEWTDRPFLRDKLWRKLNEADKGDLIACCLQSNIPAVIDEALAAIADSSPMPIFEPILESRIQSNAFKDKELLANAWLNTLTRDQPNVENRVLAALERKSISLQQFSHHSHRLNCCSERSLQILLEGATTLHFSDADDFGEAYLQLHSNQIQAIDEIKSRGKLGIEWIANFVAKKKWNDPQIALFAETAMRSTQGSTRTYGVQIIGNIGRTSSSIVSDLKGLFEIEFQKNEQRISGLSIACATTLFKIEKDLSYTDRLLQQIAKNESIHKKHLAYMNYDSQRILQEIVEPGSKYTQFIITQLSEFDPRRIKEIDYSSITAEQWIRLALRTGSPQARDCVIRFSNSKDAILSRIAKEQLRDEK